MHSRHRVLLLVVPLAVAIVLRLYPYFYTGVPWGTDEWPLIRNANELLSNSITTMLANPPVFDSTDIYWPGVSLFGAVSSVTLGSSPLEVMPVIIPLVSSFSTLFFFLIVEKLSKSSIVACIASLFFASAGFDAIFSASTTKETFAYPLFLLAIYLMLDKADARNLTIFALVSIALILSHHATVVILISIAAAFAISNAALSLAGYRKLGKSWIYPLLVAFIFGSYIELYATVFLSATGLGFVISAGAILSLSAFYFVPLLAALYFSLTKSLRSMLGVGLLQVALGLVLLYLSTKTSIIPFAPTLSVLIALLTIPYIAVGFLAVFGYKVLHDSDRSAFVPASVWLAAVVGLLGYVLIGDPNGIVLVYRFFTFAYVPIVLFAAIALGSLVSGSNKIWRISLVAIIVVGIVIGSGLMSYSSVVGKQNVLAGHYAYSNSDFTSAQFVNKVLPSNSQIGADDQILYLYQGYFNISVSPQLGYGYIEKNVTVSANSTQFLVTYSLMWSEGYDIFLYGLPVSGAYLGFLLNSSSLVFNNGNEMVWK